MKFSNEEFITKLKEEENITKHPLTSYSMNTIIFEDNPYKTIKIYDSSLFNQMNIFKIQEIERKEIEEDLDLVEKSKKREKEKSDFELYISKMKKIISDIESSTNDIKLNMEKDKVKKEELKRQEKERILKERKEREELERNRKIEEERIKIEQARIKRIREEQEKQRNDIIGLEGFNNGGRNIKERLINAGKNFENIKEEIKKISNDGNLMVQTFKVSKAINDLITNKTTSINNIGLSIGKLDQLLKEIKQKNNQSLFLYANYCILTFIFKKLKEIDSEISYENIIICAKIIISLNCKTLTYMFFQRVSNKCPYIIPLPYSKVEHDKIFSGQDLNEVYKLCRDAEYIYFTFLFLDIGKYINIVEDYISNLEKFTHKNMNFLITNSFLCFIDVLGNYIWRSKKNWINRIIKIKENVIKGLNDEANKVANTESHLVAINKTIKLKIENCFNELNSNQNTNFIKKYNELNKQ